MSQALTRQTYTQVIQVVNFLCYKYPTFGRGSAGEYQADEQAGVTGLSWRVTIG